MYGPRHRRTIHIGCAVGRDHREERGSWSLGGVLRRSSGAIIRGRCAGGILFWQTRLQSARGSRHEFALSSSTLVGDAKTVNLELHLSDRHLWLCNALIPLPNSSLVLHILTSCAVRRKCNRCSVFGKIKLEGEMEGRAGRDWSVERRDLR